MRCVLEDLFGLLSMGTGHGGTSAVRPTVGTYTWRLAQNAPNPCTGSTLIRFAVANRSRVAIKVYDARGKLVTILIDETLDPGQHSLRWDGTTAAGQRVSSGVYFFRMQAPAFSDVKKMLIIN